MSAPASRELLLLCAHATLSAERRTRVEQLARGPLDWDDVLKGAAWHGVTALLADNLRGITGVPDAFQQNLHRLQQVNAFRSLNSAANVRRALASLDKAGVEAIAWKGPALAFEAFGSLTKRSSCDIDFLVKPGQLTVARDALLEAGYAFEPDVQRLTAARRSRMEQMSGEIRLLGPKQKYLLELHEDFLPATMRDPRLLSRMWQRSQIVTGWDGEPLRRLSTSDLLLTLCVHATKHGWDRLKWVADIAAILERQANQIDWDVLLRGRDSSAECRGMVLIGVGLAHRNLGAPVPAEILSEIKAQPVLHRLVERQDSAYVVDRLASPPFFHALRMRLCLVPMAKQLQVIAKETISVDSLDVETFPAADKWLWLTPVYRPWHIAGRQLEKRATMRRIHGPSEGRVSRWCSKWVKLSKADKAFFLRATLVLLLIRVGLWTCAFRRVLALTDTVGPPPLPLPGTQPPSPQQCAELIPSAARLIPRASCLTQALAGRWFLKSTGQECELEVGVAKHGGEFSAHAVLLHKGTTLLGANTSGRTYQRIFSC